MGRIRTIKPDFFQHSGLFDLEQETHLPIRLAYAGLWTCADRDGRFKWRPRELKVAVLPYDDCDFSRVLDALATRGFIVKYASGTEFFGHIPTWAEHQFINNKEPKSGLPNPPVNKYLDANATRDSRVNDVNDTRGVKEGKGREGNEEGKGMTRQSPVPDSVDARILSEQVGIFGMREQADMLRCLAAFALSSGKPTAECIEHMTSRWTEYQVIMPTLEWQYGSSYKFFMSGKWDDPRSWPRGKDAQLEQKYTEFLK